MSKKKKPRYKLETPETKAKFDAISAKHGLKHKMRHIVTSYEAQDGRVVVRFGPEVLLAVEGDQANWFAPVNPATARRAFESQESYQQQQAIFREMERSRTSAKSNPAPGADSASPGGPEPKHPQRIFEP